MLITVEPLKLADWKTANSVDGPLVGSTKGQVDLLVQIANKSYNIGLIELDTFEEIIDWCFSINAPATIDNLVTIAGGIMANVKLKKSKNKK